MKKSFLTIMLIMFCVVCVAQNTASKYLADAKKALAEGHYDQAKKLAAVYNKLTESNRGDDIIKEAQVHIQCDSLVQKASEQFMQEQYVTALSNYVAAYELFNDKSLYPGINKCSASIIENGISVTVEPEMAKKLYQIHLDSSKSVEQDISILQVAALYGNGLAAEQVGYYLMGKKDYENAIKFYGIARDAHRDVSNNMGSCYSRLANNVSDSSKKNQYLKKAYELFLESANNNNRVGQYNVGICLLEGRGTTRNTSEALSWLQKSSENGYELAKDKLAELDKEIAKNNDENKTLTVTGHVRDSKEPLIGAGVYLNRDAKIGTCTGLEGEYTLSNVPSNGTLEFEYIGYKTRRVWVNGKTTIDVTLQKEDGPIKKLFDDDPYIGAGLISDFNKFPIGVKGDFLWGLVHFGLDLSAGSSLFYTEAYAYASSSNVVTVNGVPIEPTVELVKSGEDKTRGVFAFTITPGLFYKHISLDCGLGYIWTKTSRTDTYKYTYNTSSSSGDGGTSISTSSSTGRTEEKRVETSNSFFVLKPGITTVFGDGENVSVIVGASYRICPREKAMNGFELSVGVAFPLF